MEQVKIIDNALGLNRVNETDFSPSWTSLWPVYPPFWFDSLIPKRVARESTMRWPMLVR